MCSVSSRLRDDAPALVHQVRQHAELVAGQLHRRAVERDPRAPRIERDARRSAAPASTWPLGAADQRAQPRQHLLDPERLGHVVVGAAVDALDLLVPAAARGQDQHRHGEPGLAPAAQQRQAVDPAAGRGRGPRRRSARSARGSRRARRPRRSPRRSPRRRARSPAARASSASSSTTRTRRPAPPASFIADPDAERRLNARVQGPFSGPPTLRIVIRLQARHPRRRAMPALISLRNVEQELRRRRPATSRRSAASTSRSARGEFVAVGASRAAASRRCST